MINSDENLKINYVNHSYNELNQINNEIIDYITSESFKYDNYVSHYIDEINNIIIVELENNSLEAQNEFKEEIVNSDLITFIEGEKLKVSAYNPGQSLISESDFTQCSLGYRAKMNGMTGFVTAGHCDTKVSINGSFSGYGTLKKRVFSSGKVDAAFIQTSTSITKNLASPAGLTTSLSSNEALSYSSMYVVGQIIGKSGASTGGTTGKITNTSISYTTVDEYTDTSYNMVDMIATDVYTDGGDSGGPVFAQGGVIIGINQSRNSSTNYMYATKYTNIKSALGATIY